MQGLFLLLVGCAMVNAFPKYQQRIVGGWETSVSQYPEVVSLLYSHSGAGHRQACGGTVINIRSILTAAHCVVNDYPARWRVRVGSSYANSGGTVYNAASLIVHAGYDRLTNDKDIAILRTSTSIVYGTLVKQGSIAGSTYSLGDNQSVWGVGWGKVAEDGSASAVLRHTRVWSVNQSICGQRYAEIGAVVTQGMLCSGWLDVGGRDQCQGDSGSPLFHNKVVVGICSWGSSCAQARYPGVNTRVSSFAVWIQANA